MAAENRENALLFTRELAAPRDLVFEVWSDPAHMERWFGPIGFTVTCQMEFRPGGALAIRMVGHGMDNWVRGTYREIVRPERIVMTMRFDDVPEHEMVQTVSFAAQGGKTLLTVKHVLPPLDAMSPAHQALVRPRYAGAQEGWSQTLRNLETYLATLVPART